MQAFSDCLALNDLPGIYLRLDVRLVIRPPAQPQHEADQRERQLSGSQPQYRMREEGGYQASYYSAEHGLGK